MGLWKKNLFVSEIPWSYYLHPCCKLYAEELAGDGRTLWINPPTRNPFSMRLSIKNRNLLLFKPLMFKRSVDGLGFWRWEVKLQIYLITRIFLGKPSSIWSISTAYDYLLRMFRPRISIFWSGDFFNPKKEFENYAQFDLTLCLTPDKFKQIPQAYSGEKMHFNMSCSGTFFEDRDKLKNNPAIRQIIRKMEKYDTVAGYVGTLSMRRLDDELLEHLAKNLPNFLFLFIGKGDGTQNTDLKLEKLRRNENFVTMDGFEYDQLPEVIELFDFCLIPYRTDEANLGTCPTKFIEYCAIGKPIIGTRLPGLEKFGDLLLLSDEKDEFTRHLRTGNSYFDEEVVTNQQKLAINSSPRNFIEEFARKTTKSKT